MQLLSDRSNADLCLQATLALGEFTDVAEVMVALRALILQPTESFDLRYAAFTSIQRAGATLEAVQILRSLNDDEVLGRAAAIVLHSLQIP